MRAIEARREKAEERQAKIARGEMTMVDPREEREHELRQQAAAKTTRLKKAQSSHSP